MTNEEIAMKIAKLVDNLMMEQPGFGMSAHQSNNGADWAMCEVCGAMKNQMGNFYSADLSDVDHKEDCELVKLHKLLWEFE